MQFRRRDLARYWEGGPPPKYLPSELRTKVEFKLATLESATNLNDLRIPPSNHLEKLHGDLDGFHSIRVNKQYRLVFRWTDEGATDVNFTDYH